jgi:hypothetical protein
MKHLKDQEKGQLTLTDETELHGWADQRSTRKVIKPEHIYNSELDAYEYSPGSSEKFNYMPPGMDRSNQYPDTTERQYPLKPSHATGTEGEFTAKDLERGFKRGKEEPAKDLKEEYPDFYGEVKGENDGGDKTTGFLERENVADRN